MNDSRKCIQLQLFPFVLEGKGRCNNIWKHAFETVREKMVLAHNTTLISHKVAYTQFIISKKIQPLLT